MPRGMKYPISVSPLGGSNIVEGTNIIDQNIILALTPAGSLNPWNQKLTPDEDIIFDINDNQTGGIYTMHVRDFFQEMELHGYARLFPGNRGINIIYASDSIIVNIQYENLETGKEEKIQIIF